MKNINLLASLQRPALQEKLRSEFFDLLVIGGGITGAGIALDAAARGYKVALVEKDDFASGTSSRSTKLIHGGLRYLKQFEIALVREVGRERAIVHSLAPHLVTAEKMLLPLIADGTYGKLATSVGLMVYDVLAGVEEADQRVMLSKEETLAKEPLLNASNLEGGGFYAEYRTDDARLTIEVIKTACFYGASAINYTKAIGFVYENGQVGGVVCTDTLTNETYNIRSRFVVSAAGPWVDQVRQVNEEQAGKRLHLTKGVHLVVPHERFPVKQAIYFDVPDGRMIFAIPRQQVTYIGTTDTDYHGDINRVVADKADAEYLINAVNHTFPTLNLSLADVESSWAGLRPLIHEEGKSASALSRKDEIFESSTGLISIAGGKLTGYRKMAERIVDLVDKRHRKLFDTEKRKCQTHRIPLANGGLGNAKDVKRYRKELYTRLSNTDLQKKHVRYLVGNYGRQADIILSKFFELEGENAQVMLMQAELWYCLTHEAVHTALDFFNRRTGRLYFDIASVSEFLQAALAYMQAHFQWSEQRVQAEMQAVMEAINDCRIS